MGAFDIFLELRDKRLEAFELLSMARIHARNNGIARAVSDAEDAREIYRALKSPKEVTAITVIFQAYMGGKDIRKALRTARDAAKYFKASKDKAAEAEALEMLVRAFTANGRIPDALEAAEKAIAVFQDQGNQQKEARLSSAIAGLNLRMQRFDRALQTGEDAAVLFREVGGTT